MENLALRSNLTYPRLSHPKWTIEQTARLIELWADGSKSAAQIAKIIGGYSRNAIIGKVHRMGLPQRGRKAAITRLPKPKPVKILTFRPKAVVPQIVDFNIPTEQRRTFLQLAKGHCRWPVGEGETMFFCGGTKKEGSSYCDGHHARSVRT